MNSAELLEIWAPLDGAWSLWVRPVLFAQMKMSIVEDLTLSKTLEDKARWLGLDRRWMLEGPKKEMALVIDLPGEDSVVMGILAAVHGYRPVPLYNGCAGPSEAVDQRGIIAELRAQTRHLKLLSLPPDSPPAFLLDAHRLQPSRSLSPGDFDNRWMVFPQDLPSGGLLKERGISKVIVFRRRVFRMEGDLSRVLYGWQGAGLSILEKEAGDGSRPDPIVVPRLRWYKSMALWLTANLSLRRNSGGGFGGVIPYPSHG